MKLYCYTFIYILTLTQSVLSGGQHGPRCGCGPSLWDCLRPDGARPPSWGEGSRGDPESRPTKVEIPKLHLHTLMPHWRASSASGLLYLRFVWIIQGFGAHEVPIWLQRGTLCSDLKP